MFAAHNIFHTAPRDIGVSSVSWPTFPANTMPPGITQVQISDGAFRLETDAITVNASGVMREPQSRQTNGTYRSMAVFPDKMVDLSRWVKVGNGGGSASSDRGFGCGFSNASGTKAVYTMHFNGSSQSRLYSLDGTAFTSRANGTSASSTSGSDVMELRLQRSGADVIYSVYKNGSATTLTWTDTGEATVGEPILYPCIVFTHIYSVGQYYSPGVDSLEAGLL